MAEHEKRAMRRSEATGVVLAGGKSTRMGQDKAALLLDGEPLLARVVRRLQHALADVLIVGPAEIGALVPGLRVVQDTEPGRGPLAGLSSALRAISTPWAFVVACDMPFIEPALVRAMVDLAVAPPEVDAVVLRTQRGTEKLHTAYAKTCLPAVDNQLAAGDLALHRLLSAIRVREMPWSDAVRYDPAGYSAFNANTPEDWARARALLHQSGTGSSSCRG